MSQPTDKEKDTLRRVQEGLYHLQRALQPFIAERMETKLGKRWILYASRAQGASPQSALDTYGLLKTMLDQWVDVFDAAFPRNDKFRVRNFLSTAFEARNVTAHLGQPLKDAEALRYLDAMVCLSRAVKGPKVDVDELAKLYEAQRHDGVAPATKGTSASPSPAPGALSLGFAEAGAPIGALRPWIEVAFPHTDVLDPRQAEFAADLAAVDMGRASGNYATAENFFRITFLTEGLKRVLRTALQRLAGQGGDPVLGLQTSFGGGKTHTMLALYHLAKASELSLLPGVAELAAEVKVDAVGGKSWRPVKMAVFVGTAKGVDAALILSGGPPVRTLWSYIAWRLAGRQGVDLMREAELRESNPGSERIVALFRMAGPSIILLDEVVAFARQLDDRRFEAFLSFMQSLTEAAKMVPDVLLVGSLPESDVEAGGAKGVEALRRLEKVFGRTGSPWLAANGNETYEIVRRRLFQQLDSEGEKARDETAKAFHDLYRKNPVEFPTGAKEPRYGELLRLSYPIHPELFDRLSKDWSTLEKFQKTRGVLRFMADVVSVLWQARSRDPMILPARVPIADARVKASVVYPLDAAFSAVVDSEVDGAGSLPARMEANPSRRITQTRAATRAARAIFLCSAPNVGQPNGGVTGQAIRLAAAEPGDQLEIFGEAVRELHERATYLYEDGGRYWFSTQPTLGRLAEERAGALPAYQVDEEIVRVLAAEASHRNGFAKVNTAPDDPGMIDETTSLTLVVLGPALVHSRAATASPALEAASQALTRCRNSQRRYRNTLIFVAPDELQLATAREVTRKAMAWTSIERDTGIQQQLKASQIADVKEKTKMTRQAAAMAIRAAWTHILLPEKSAAALDGRAFEIVQTTMMARDRTSIVVSVYDKVSPRGDGLVKDTLGPKMLLAKLYPLWPADKPHLSIADMREWFAAYVYLPKLREPTVLDVAIADGVCGADPSFGYADAFDEATGRYQGLAYGRLPPAHFPPGAVLIRKEVAWKQPRDDLGDDLGAGHGPAAPSPGSPAGQPGGPPYAHGTVSPRQPGMRYSDAAARPRRFQGSVEIDVGRPAGSFEAIVNCVVMELQRTPGAKVTLTLQIAAEAADGFADGDVGVVRDNARQLKFKADSTGFES